MKIIHKIIKTFLYCFAGTMLVMHPAHAEWSGNLAFENRHFIHEGLYPEQEQNYSSVSAIAEYHREWDDGNQSFIFSPFLRVDQHDDERTHVDIRELSWIKAAQDWELRMGIRKIFWGVTESQHLVDIINQTDVVENIDDEDKLGQAMINIALIRDWGTVDLFMLPGFREQKFPGAKGRFRYPLPETNKATYQSSDENKHIDWAARYSHYLGDWDFALSYFFGTNRQPNLTPDTANNAMQPHYDLIRQVGLDLQTTQEGWLWKLEVISRQQQDQSYTALTGGFEYTIVGILDSSADLGIITEYLYQEDSPISLTPFDDDIMLGARLALNDESSTEVLLGGIFDLNHQTRLLTIEASRRLGDAWKLSVEGRAFNNTNASYPMYQYRQDDHILLDLAWYF